jgi:hypothetical protein
MIVSIHQPHFLPWMGYMNKVMNSDKFVWLDTVQFRKNYFQNRTKIKSITGVTLWLTLPVHNHLGDLISDIRISESAWKKKIIGKIHANYSKAPYYSKYSDALYEVWAGCESDSLADINLVTFMHLKELLNIQTDISLASEMQIQSSDPTGRLVEICRKLGATAYIAGRGGKDYMNLALFEKENIKVIWQDFDPGKVSYSQIGDGYVAGLSIIDCLFNVGQGAAENLTQRAWVAEQN